MKLTFSQARKRREDLFFTVCDFLQMAGIIAAAILALSLIFHNMR